MVESTIGHIQQPDHSELKKSLAPFGLVIRGSHPEVEEVVILVDGQEKRFPIVSAVVTVDNSQPTETFTSTMLVPPRSVLKELTGRTDF